MSGPYRGGSSESLHWEAGGAGLPSGWRIGNGGQPRYGWVSPTLSLLLNQCC
jgi:hypothetical protein